MAPISGHVSQLFNSKNSSDLRKQCSFKLFLSHLWCSTRINPRTIAFSSSCDLLSDEHLYADDTTLTYADNDFDQILTVMNRDLHALDDWLNKNKLSLNVIKTKCMFIGTRQKLATLPSPHQTVC